MSNRQIQGVAGNWKKTRQLYKKLLYSELSQAIENLYWKRVLQENAHLYVMRKIAERIRKAPLNNLDWLRGES